MSCDAEAVAGRHAPDPGLHLVALDLADGSACLADEMMVVGGPAQPEGLLAVALEGVDLACVGQRGQCPVHGREPRAPLIGAQAMVKLLGGDGVGTAGEGLEYRKALPGHP